jgi:hypothetical protein
MTLRGQVPVGASHNGGMALADHHGVGLPGVRQGDDGPFPRSLEQALCRGKGLGSAIRVLWGPRCAHLLTRVPARRPRLPSATPRLRACRSRTTSRCPSSGRSGRRDRSRRCRTRAPSSRGKKWLSGFFSIGSTQKPLERPYAVSTTVSPHAPARSTGRADLRAGDDPPGGGSAPAANGPRAGRA